jgi:Mn-dependent DtxR family transcriptional regulator
MFGLMGVPKDVAAVEAFKFERVLTAESAQKLSALFRNLMQNEKGRKLILEMTSLDEEEIKSGALKRRA